MNTETVRALLTDSDRFAEAVIQADITHLCCMEELTADCFAHMTAANRILRHGSFRCLNGKMR